MLYPGAEVRPLGVVCLPQQPIPLPQASLVDIAAAIVADLPQTTWDPITAGQVRGTLVPALSRSSADAVVWCTSVSGEGSQANLGVMASLSSAVGLARGGENVGGVDAPADMLTSIGMARRHELSTLMWLPPHTPDDPGNLTSQLPLLAALTAVADMPSTLCSTAVAAPAILFSPSLGAFLALTTSVSGSALELVSTNVTDTHSLRGEVLWSTGPLTGSAIVAIVINSSAGALQLQREDGSVAWSCAGPAVALSSVLPASRLSPSAGLFLTLTDAPELRLYSGSPETPGAYTDVSQC